MIMVRGDKEKFEFANLNTGGIFLDDQNSEEAYKSLIDDYQNNSKIKFFVATDLEGVWNPFPNKGRSFFPFFSEINTSDDAYSVGLKHGKLLNYVGFNLNFAPVAEYSDNVYGGRTFKGNQKEVEEKIKSYINGLQKSVLGTCKHYPGNSMEKNLHLVADLQYVSADDLKLFDVCLENNISSIMVSHQIVSGKLDSNGKPSSVSKEVISSINDSVLIISDEINMGGISVFYNDKVDLYTDLINSGENLILDFDLTPGSLYKLILKIENEVEKGNIDESKIDHSVEKILKLKGYSVV
jgi:beta-N-acetylhexosaminidase